MTTTRKPYDRKQPGTRELWESIVHGAAITEGTMIAFPTCFPAVTEQLPHDESRMRALDITADGIVYAGTSGYACHLLVGMFHGITGVVFDMGVVEGATECSAICCGTKSFAAAVNCEDKNQAGRLVVRELQRLPFDLIQEWHFNRSPYRYVGPIVPGEPILHAVATADRQSVVGITPTRLFTYHFETEKIDIIGEIPGAGRIAVGPGGHIYGADGPQSLWRFDPAARKLDRHAIALPGAPWDPARMIWAKDETGAGLYTVSAGGQLYHLTGNAELRGPLASIPLSPVSAMAVTRDGRLFASAGEGIARTFCYRPATGKVADLGVAVSVFERRRYGYCFGDAVVGRDGEIIWAENDNLGHLWLYFPSIERK